MNTGSSVPPQAGLSASCEIRIDNNLSEITRVADMVDDFAARHQFPEQVLFALNVVLDEIINNIISYGYEDAGPHEIAVRVALRPGNVEAVVEDDGKPFDPLAAPAPDLTSAQREPGGVGLSDAIIIGAGVIGAATAFELCKRGYQTLNIDKLPAAGYGPTSSSCSIVRAHYSSWDGVAMAHEGFSYWRDWPNYLEIDTNEHEIAKYMQCGTVLLKSNTGHHEKVLEHFRTLGVEHEEWDTDTLKSRIPYYDVHEFWPPSRPEEPDFWRQPDEELEGAIYTSGSGYVNDPKLATHDLQLAAEAKGGTFLFDTRIVEIRRSGGRVRGVTLDSGEEIDAPVVVNVAGPHSFVINRMAGVEETMNIKTRALRHEVHIVPAPPGVDYEHEGFHTSDGDQGIYFRPEAGNNILIGSEIHRATRRCGSRSRTSSIER